MRRRTVRRLGVLGSDVLAREPVMRMAIALDDPALPGRTLGFDAASLRSYDKQLHRYLARGMPKPQDAEDLVQEVYLRLLRVDRTKQVHKPLAYIYGIASHVVADYRSGTRHERAFLSDDKDELPGRGAEPLVDELLERLNLQQQLERALDQLPLTQAQVLIAHKYQGLSYEEVAEELGLSIHTVEKYVTQAKAKIRTMAWER
jgi:RNA polymerase sigma factor (sigma-70 family)